MSGRDDIREAVENAKTVDSPADDRASSTRSGRRSGGNTQAADLVALAEANAAFFHAPDQTAYADLHIDGHRETMLLRSRAFGHWLSGHAYKAGGTAPGSEMLSTALNILEAKARFDGSEHPVFVRVAARDGSIFIDLGDPTWRAVEVSPSGWRIVATPPVRFRRPRGLAGLPTPQPGGSIHLLRRFVNFRSDRDFVLVITWLLAAFRGSGPYPVIAISGEQGSAKSTFTRLLRRLVDPNVVELRAFSRNERELYIAAMNSHVLAFDNLSFLPANSSDALCRIATGGGFAARENYTDAEEMLFQVVKPVILNGIDDVATRADLADRSILVRLDSIPEHARRPETDLWADFEADAPKIIGALLDGLVTGLERLPSIRLEKSPRMSDFAYWGAACEPAFWPPGTFMAAYESNIQEAASDLLEVEPLAISIRSHMSGIRQWMGKATDLLAALNNATGDRFVGHKKWPGSPAALGSALRRIAPAMRKTGINIEHDRRGHGRDRMVTISLSNPGQSIDDAELPSAPSALSAAASDPCASPASVELEVRTADTYADRDADTAVRFNTADLADADSADGADIDFALEAAKEWSDEWLARQ